MNNRGNTMNMQSVHVLLVEDNEGDVRLVREALKDGKVAINLHAVTDGEQAMEFLFRKGRHRQAVRPDIVLLDLNLPGKDGREVLRDMKGDPDLRRIPVVVLTTSSADEDVLKAYNLHANAYLTKPVKLDDFVTIMKSFEEFWLTLVKLPGR
jgi:CheY-like chemotaxis protein